jgi:hypothetical protein
MLTKEEIISFLDWHEVTFKNQHDERLLREVCHQANKANELTAELAELRKRNVPMKPVEPCEYCGGKKHYGWHDEKKPSYCWNCGRKCGQAIDWSDFNEEKPE